MRADPADVPSTVLTVACAAIKRQDGSIWFVERPQRHHDVIRLMAKTLGWSPGELRVTYDATQGFLLSDGRFVNRKAAKLVAIKAGQLLPRANAHSTELFSEDVW